MDVKRKRLWLVAGAALAVVVAAAAVVMMRPNEKETANQDSAPVAADSEEVQKEADAPELRLSADEVRRILLRGDPIEEGAHERSEETSGFELEATTPSPRDESRSTGPKWRRSEKEYAAEYADRALAKDPDSRDALMVKILAKADVEESARLLIERHPHDDEAVDWGTRKLVYDYPEEMMALLLDRMPEDGLFSNWILHHSLGKAYERLDMLAEAADQYQRAFAVSDQYPGWNHDFLAAGERAFPSIWEERAAAGEAVGPPAQSVSAEGAAPIPPSERAHEEDPPPVPSAEAERDIAEAYAEFAEAYRGAFEAEYGLTDDTPEGRMSALLDIARAFAKSGDAENAQAAYNAARKRYTRAQVEEAFRRLDGGGEIPPRLQRRRPQQEER